MSRMPTRRGIQRLGFFLSALITFWLEKEGKKVTRFQRGYEQDIVPTIGGV